MYDKLLKFQSFELFLLIIYCLWRSIFVSIWKKQKYLNKDEKYVSDYKTIEWIIMLQIVQKSVGF